MNPEIKARWVAALRSGEFEQGKEFLNKGGKMCCLGVLCELAVRDGIVTVDRDYVSAYGRNLVIYMLPHEVQEWAGVDDNPRILVTPGVTSDVNHPGPESYLTVINDAGTPFSVIADVIEEQL